MRVGHFRSTSLHILSQYQTHHLIPHSGKVVIFDSQLVVKHAFDAMVLHDLSCAPVWDSAKKKYVGLLSVSDFLDVLLGSFSMDKNETEAMYENLSNARICEWSEWKRSTGTSINRLLCISPEATLHEAVRQLLNYRVHRLCVVQLALADTVLRIITNHGILRFLRNNIPPAISSTVTIRHLGIGVFENLLTLTMQTPVIKALNLLSAYKISSIPIVDENNRPIDVYSRADVRFLALDQTWTNLDMSVEDALSKHRTGRVLALCSRDDSVHTVSGLLVQSMRHSIICVKHDGTIDGVVSLTDIFTLLLNNSSASAAESRIAALKRDYQQFEQAEVEREAMELREREEAERQIEALRQQHAEQAEAAALQRQHQQPYGASSSWSLRHSIRQEELLKQRTFQREHGLLDEMGSSSPTIQPSPPPQIDHDHDHIMMTDGDGDGNAQQQQPPYPPGQGHDPHGSSDAFSSNAMQSALPSDASSSALPNHHQHRSSQHPQ